MSATTNTTNRALGTNPLILRGDSMFESSDLFGHPQGPDSVLGNEIIPMKHESMEELSSHLPLDDQLNNDLQKTSPFNIHSSVLDSVFSSTMDENDQLHDHTPMFDELDFIMDEGKASLKDDWVSLFGGNDESGKREEPEVSMNAPTKRSYSEVDKFETIEESVEPEFESVPPKQLFTPTHSNLSTPIIDTQSKVNKNKKAKVDHLGCVSYSKKQRSQLLAPVATEAADPMTMKRARNTEAARRSRARKLERMNQLEGKVEELINEKTELANEVLRLKEILAANGISH
ncbi:uncharacterized protein AC631_04468 [Debaryomyces fabryi]|uniref:BZIP domain-containing protein n=1 Tax=Debaryomyces fabryi TaxID=58627 RepID=A0A0V1PUB2_9ASCO|nr:uncharacterized protein AC631_04468 [Debaryomyces fabryi]KRZ99775.1 hypothetical protein AC631_04468 [Debaryomyces fabryi]CUM57260.1 unnamed protein product [Debaryomyces fabryi]